MLHSVDIRFGVDHVGSIFIVWWATYRYTRLKKRLITRSFSRCVAEHRSVENVLGASPVCRTNAKRPGFEWSETHGEDDTFFVGCSWHFAKSNLTRTFSSETFFTRPGDPSCSEPSSFHSSHRKLWWVSLAPFCPQTTDLLGGTPTMAKGDFQVSGWSTLAGFSTKLVGKVEGLRPHAMCHGLCYRKKCSMLKVALLKLHVLASSDLLRDRPFRLSCVDDQGYPARVVEFWNESSFYSESENSVCFAFKI